MERYRQRAENRTEHYLQHDVGRIMSAAGCIKITRQAGRLAVRADVDIYRPTIDTAESSAHNILLATASTSEKRYGNIWGESPT